MLYKYKSPLDTNAFERPLCKSGKVSIKKDGDRLFLNCKHSVLTFLLIDKHYYTKLLII